MSCSLQSPSKETTAIISASQQLSVRGGYVWCRITQSCQLLCLSFLEIRPSSFSSSTRNTASYGASLTFSKCKIRSFESGSRRSHNLSVLPSQVSHAGFFPAKENNVLLRAPFRLHKILNQRKKMTNTIHLNEVADAVVICTAVRISMKLKAHH